METVDNIINDYLDLTEKEIELIFEMEEIKKNVYNEIFLKNEDKIVELTKIDPYKVDLAVITESMYKFYSDEIRKYFIFGYVMAKRND